ncbi:MAG: hypothetical protein ACRYF0_17310 [Janthinobacterium lividum]
MALIGSACSLHYADRSIELSGPSLMFANPRIPYSVEMPDTRLMGYSCIFTEEFMKEGDRSDSLQQSPLFKVGGTSVFLSYLLQHLFQEAHQHYPAHLPAGNLELSLAASEKSRYTSYD